MIKKILALFVILILSTNFVQSREREYIGLSKLDAESNAYLHNNYGLGYLEIGQYHAAIQEFKIAISLNPGTQATALYFNNLGETYLKLGYYRAAQDCFENSIDKAPLTFRYYLNLVTSYEKQGVVKAKLKELSKNKKTPLDDITLGLLYIANNETDKGIAVLDNFVMNEPKLFITDGVKYYLKGIIDERKNGMR